MKSLTLILLGNCVIHSTQYVTVCFVTNLSLWLIWTCGHVACGLFGYTQTKRLDLDIMLLTFFRK